MDAIRAIGGFGRLRADGWTIGAMAIASLISVPILAVIALALTPGENIWAHL